MPARRLRRAAAVILVGIALAAASDIDPPAASASQPDPGERFDLVSYPHKTVMSRFGDTWGAARSGGRRHRGTDIMAPKGVSIVAVADGDVTHMDWNRLSGWNIVLRHADDWTSHYIHLNNDRPGTDDGEGGVAAAFAAGLAVGDFVEAGEVIGYVGDSGNAEGTGSHTHFELHHDGNKVNPYPFLADAWERQINMYDKAGDLR